MWLIVNISTNFRKKMFDIYCIFVYHYCKRGDAREKTRHRETETEQRNDTVNQRIDYSIANEVAVDLLGHREMHACRASMPVVAPSQRVPVWLNAQRGGFTPPYTHRR